MLRRVRPYVLRPGRPRNDVRAGQEASTLVEGERGDPTRRSMAKGGAARVVSEVRLPYTRHTDNTQYVTHTHTFEGGCVLDKGAAQLRTPSERCLYVRKISSGREISEEDAIFVVPGM